MKLHSWSMTAAAAWLAVVVACSPLDTPANRARDLERRILAPCCRRQTLEDHESELAGALRTEIVRRIAAGVPAAVIEDDLVRRYGEDIRAMPRGQDPRTLLGGALGLVLALGGLVVGLTLWRGRKRYETAAPVPDGAELSYQDRIDADLLELE
jgi:cytochrome c-type biogenesis protein CcmH